ncbi:hypothetical protein [Nonomuraea sp. NPDC049646]|uniref:hypothetical protein n=1 Tax=unclassified Nonomuraea TaxID=2593643 RepID=UPI003790F6FC
MWQTILLSFSGSLVAGNGLPHFIRGITRRRYPSALGNGPVPNLVAGWAGLVVRYPALSFASIGVGVLLIGLFHAGPGAFGREETSQ